MKLHKLYLSLAAGALSVVPVVAAETPAAKPEAKPAVKAEAPKELNLYVICSESLYRLIHNYLFLVNILAVL